MNQITTTIKLDKKVKHDAQAIAKSLGLSLSAIIENKLKEVIRDKKVVFQVEPKPNDSFYKELEKIESDIKSNKNLSKKFSNFDELKQYLNNL